MRNELKIKIYQANNPTFRVLDGVDEYDRDTYHKVFERYENPEEFADQTDHDILEGLFEEFNLGEYPEEYTGHSMSVGDIVEINDVAYICSNFGWDKVEWK